MPQVSSKPLSKRKLKLAPQDSAKMGEDKDITNHHHGTVTGKDPVGLLPHRLLHHCKCNKNTVLPSDSV